MPGINETLFQEHLPTITEAEALAAFRENGAAISVSGFKVSPGFVLRFATENGPLPPVVISPHVIERLRALLDRAPIGGVVPPT